MVSQVVLFSDDSNLTSDSFLIFVKMPGKDRWISNVKSLASNDVLFVLELKLQNINRSYLHQLIHITHVSLIKCFV